MSLDAAGSGRARHDAVAGALMLVAGIGVAALPGSLAAVAGLLVLYGIAALAIVGGVVNLVGALRVREVARWLMPASLIVLVLGVAALAAPPALGAAVTRT